MSVTTTVDVRPLVRSDSVHHSVYSDPAIFELEMDKIFGTAWLMLGHESQVQAAGDYFLTRMGREQVIVTRDAKGRVQVLMNRCTHRGATLCQNPKGHAHSFVCPYHGWAFDLRDGACKTVPGKGVRSYPVQIVRDAVCVKM
jgi:phenylpropionate dioxygenase-like ring-hydroxylating dioxygenase large terminal subunit